MDNQLLIKIILIAVFAVFAAILIIPGRGARRVAVRRIVLLFVFIGAVIAVAAPELIDGIAKMLGVGRGTDLILYALVIVFIGNAVTSASSHRHMERELTLLARHIALKETPVPASNSDASTDDRG